MSLLDWVYPPKCLSCRIIFPPIHNAPYPWLCNNCRPLLSPITSPFCHVCGHPVNLSNEAKHICPSCKPGQFKFATHRAAFVYNDVIKELIHNIKFRGEKQAATGLGNLLAEEVQKWDISLNEEFLNADCIVPVPLHPSKKRMRGFNQSAVLAVALSKFLNIPIYEDMLKRIIKTVPQSGLSPYARRQNLIGAFTYNRKRYKVPKKIILIDDIFTSGATMDACTEVFIKNGVGCVVGISLAIAIKEDSL